MILDESFGEVVFAGLHHRIASTAVLIGPLKIGAGVEISHGCVIGEQGEHTKLRSNLRDPIEIGEGTRIREHVVIQRGLNPMTECDPTFTLTDEPGRFWGTKIGKNCFIMHGCHIAHDCVLHDNVIMSPFAALGGHTRLLHYANMGIHSATHPKVTVGALTMIGMGSMVLHDIPTGMTVAGTPARFRGMNNVGIERANLGEEQIAALAHEFPQYSGARPMLRT